MSKIEQIIDEIEDYLDSCKFAALSNKKILVDKEEIHELVDELRSKTPEEIKRYQKIISNKEAIMADAQEKAEVIIAQAAEQAQIMVSEHPITQQAQITAEEMIANAEAHAQQIVDDATTEANNIRTSAMAYTDSLLKGIEDLLTNAVDTTRARYENLLSNLQSYLDVVSSNREQLNPSPAPVQESVSEEAPAEEPAYEEDKTEEIVAVEEAADEEEAEEIELPAPAEESPIATEPESEDDELEEIDINE